MKKTISESREWYALYNTKYKEYLYFDEKNKPCWTPSIFGAAMYNMTMHFAPYRSPSNKIVKIKQTHEHI